MELNCVEPEKLSTWEQPVIQEQSGNCKAPRSENSVCGFGALAHFRGNSTGIKAAGWRGWRTERPGRNCNARHYDRVCHRTCINQPRGQLR